MAPFGWIALAVLLAGGIIVAVLLRIKTDPERHHQQILELPFLTSFSSSASGYSETLQGRTDFVDRVASTRVYTTASFVIADIGDVRLALASPAGLSDFLHSGSSTTSIVIDSNKPPELDGQGGIAGAGIGRGRFSDSRNKGVTTFTLDQLQFTIQKSEIQVSGAKVPVGKGRKVVLLRRDGSVENVVDLETGTTR